MDNDGLLYEKITNYLKEEMRNGKLNVGDKLPTEMELANQFSVSRITSKRALEDLRTEGLIYRIRGSGSFISKKLDDDKAVQAEMKSGNTIDFSKIISLVIPFDTANGGIMGVVNGASRALEGTDYLLSIYCCNNSIEEEHDLLMSLYEKRVGGIIYYPISDRKNIEVINMFYLDEYPIVSIDKYFESVPINYVVSDNMNGAYLAAKHLIESGHQKVAFLSDRRIEDATSIRNRYFGYCKALKEYGMSIDKELVKNGDLYNLKPADGIEIVKELLDLGMTAACCLNDYVASFVIQCLNAIGVEVPGQISVTGFDDLEFCKYLPVQLTTVKQDMIQIGMDSANLLIESIEKGKHINMKKVIPVELIIRESSIPAEKMIASF